MTDEKNTPRAKPWIDFIPEFTGVPGTTPKERLKNHLLIVEEIMKMKELYKLATLDQDIHNAYYRMWVLDSNRLFRMSVVYRRRLAKIS